MEKTQLTLKEVFRLFATKITNRERNRAKAYQKRLDKIEKKKSS